MPSIGRKNSAKENSANRPAVEPNTIRMPTDREAVSANEQIVDIQTACLEKSDAERHRVNNDIRDRISQRIIEQVTGAPRGQGLSLNLARTIAQDISEHFYSAFDELMKIEDLAQGALSAPITHSIYWDMQISLGAHLDLVRKKRSSLDQLLDRSRLPEIINKSIRSEFRMLSDCARKITWRMQHSPVQVLVGGVEDLVTGDVILGKDARSILLTLPSKAKDRNSVKAVTLLPQGYFLQNGIILPEVAKPEKRIIVERSATPLLYPGAPTDYRNLEDRPVRWIDIQPGDLAVHGCLEVNSSGHYEILSSSIDDQTGCPIIAYVSFSSDKGRKTVRHVDYHAAHTLNHDGRTSEYAVERREVFPVNSKMPLILARADTLISRFYDEEEIKQRDGSAEIVATPDQVLHRTARIQPGTILDLNDGSRKLCIALAGTDGEFNFLVYRNGKVSCEAIDFKDLADQILTHERAHPHGSIHRIDSRPQAPLIAREFELKPIWNPKWEAFPAGTMIEWPDGRVEEIVRVQPADLQANQPGQPAARVDSIIHDHGNLIYQQDRERSNSEFETLSPPTVIYPNLCPKRQSYREANLPDFSKLRAKAFDPVQRLVSEGLLLLEETVAKRFIDLSSHQSGNLFGTLQREVTENPNKTREHLLQDLMGSLDWDYEWQPYAEEEQFEEALILIENLRTAVRSFKETFYRLGCDVIPGDLGAELAEVVTEILNALNTQEVSEDFSAGNTNLLLDGLSESIGILGKTLKAPSGEREDSEVPIVHETQSRLAALAEAVKSIHKFSAQDSVERNGDVVLAGEEDLTYDTLTTLVQLAAEALPDLKENRAMFIDNPVSKAVFDRNFFRNLIREGVPIFLHRESEGRDSGTVTGFFICFKPRQIPDSVPGYSVHQRHQHFRTAYAHLLAARDSSPLIRQRLQNAATLYALHNDVSEISGPCLTQTHRSAGILMESLLTAQQLQEAAEPADSLHPPSIRPRSKFRDFDYLQRLKKRQQLEEGAHNRLSQLVPQRELSEGSIIQRTDGSRVILLNRQGESFQVLFRENRRVREETVPIKDLLDPGNFMHSESPPASLVLGVERALKQSVPKWEYLEPGARAYFDDGSWEQFVSVGAGRHGGEGRIARIHYSLNGQVDYFPPEFLNDSYLLSPRIVLVTNLDEVSITAASTQAESKEPHPASPLEHPNSNRQLQKHPAHTRLQTLLQGFDEAVLDICLPALPGIAQNQLSDHGAEILDLSDNDVIPELRKIHLVGRALRDHLDLLAVHALLGNPASPQDPIPHNLLENINPISISVEDAANLTPARLWERLIDPLQEALNALTAQIAKEDKFWDKGDSAAIETARFVADDYKALQQKCITLFEKLQGMPEPEQSISSTKYQPQPEVLHKYNFSTDDLDQIAVICEESRRRTKEAEGRGDLPERVRSHGLVVGKYTSALLEDWLRKGVRIGVIKDKCEGETTATVKAFEIYFPPGIPQNGDAQRLLSQFPGYNVAYVDLISKEPKYKLRSWATLLQYTIIADLNLTTDTAYCIGEVHPDNSPSMNMILQQNYGIHIWGKDFGHPYQGTPVLQPVRADLRASYRNTPKEVRFELIRRYREASERSHSRNQNVTTAYGGVTHEDAVDVLMSAQTGVALRWTGPSGGMSQADEERFVGMIDEVQQILKAKGEALSLTASWGASTMFIRKKIEGKNVFEGRRRGIDRVVSRFVAQHPGALEMGVVALDSDDCQEVCYPEVNDGKPIMRIGKEERIDKDTGEKYDSWFLTFEDLDVKVRLRFRAAKGEGAKPPWHQEFYVTLDVAEDAEALAELMGVPFTYALLAGGGGGTVAAEIDQVVQRGKVVGLISGFSAESASEKYLSSADYAKWRSENEGKYRKIDTAMDLYNFLKELGAVVPVEELEIGRPLYQVQPAVGAE